MISKLLRSAFAADVVPGEIPLPETALPLADFPLEQCAAIQASIDRRGSEKGQILKENNLSEGAWAELEQHWERMIDAELERGENDLLQRFDAAYVAQIEKERGAIQVEEYARLAIAAERGTTEKVLSELSLPEEAEMRLERVWLDNMVMHSGLRERLREAKNAVSRVP